jgi:NTE family protein
MTETVEAPAKKGAAKTATKSLNLALQGGGAHGAYTWGVIDKLLEDGRITIDGISGTSAGAMNAAVTAYGLTIGGPEGAREKLHEFWKKVSDAAKTGPLQPTPLDKLFSKGNMDFSPLYHYFDALSKVMSPYQLNPANLNPLKDTIESVVDFEVLKKSDACKLFIAATDACTGRLRVFPNEEMRVECVLASACLPFLFQAVEIDGHHYWDGGYIGNPPLFPLINDTSTSDILIVQINPVTLKEPPKTAREILDRVNTLSFNSSLMRELRAVFFVTDLIDKGELDHEKHKRVHVHTIDAEEVVQGLSVSSKLNADWDFLSYMFEIGRDKATSFLEFHFDQIGKESSTDIHRKFM